MSASERPPFGDLVRTFRLRASLSQEELTERSGLSTRAISDIERGLRKSPRPETIRMLAAGLSLCDEERAELIRAARPELIQHPGTQPPQRTHFLPIPPTSLIGRNQAVEELVSRLGEGGTPLITLTGPGGVGKTRLALEIAHKAADAFPGGAFFVDLAPVTHPDMVASAMAQTLGIPETGNRPLQASLRDALATRPPLLLLLDNFEQVVDAAWLISKLLAAARGLQILITSREALRVRGELEFIVQPLDLPEHAETLDIDRIVQNPAVALFVQTAAFAKPGFSLSAEQAPAVAEICRRLDGLPLAIELAASRVRHFPPLMLLDHMETCLPMLTGGPRDLPARQQTLRATIAWSYDLLTAGEQTLFRTLGVFAGGARLDAIESVTASLSHAESDTLATLSSLVDQSLVRESDDAAGLLRFSMLQTIREFALWQLDRAGELAGARAAHARWFLRVATGADSELEVDRYDSAYAAMRSDYENFRAALELAIESGDVETARGLAGALEQYWYANALLREGRQYLEDVVDMPGDASPESTARALVGLAHIAHYQGDSSRASEVVQPALAVYQQLGDLEGIGVATFIMGIIAEDTGNLDLAETWFAEANDAKEQASDHAAIPWVRLHQGVVAHGSGDIDRAIDLYEQALRLSRGGGPTAVTLEYLGRALIRKGDLAHGATRLEEALALNAGNDFQEGVVRAISGLAYLASTVGLYEEATRLCATAESLRLQIGLRPFAFPENLDYEKALEDARRQLSQHLFTTAWAVGKSRTLSGCSEDIHEILDRARTAADDH